MRTIRTKIYKFDELTPEAKQNAINEYRNNHLDHFFIWDEAENTVNEFCAVFNVKTSNNSWLECNLYNIEDDILNLKGFRLQKYIYNNFGYKLFKPAFIGSLQSNEIKTHPRIKSKKLYNGNVFNPYYSAIKKDISGVLTGVCYDDDILKPIYDFLELRTFDNTNFEDLIKQCFEAIKNSIENEIEDRESDEAIAEEIEANEFEFLSNGKQY